MTAFNKLIGYINHQSVGDVINRSNLLKVSRDSSDAYIDTIRLKLTATGFLRATKKSGRYTLARKVPTTISSSELDRAYYLSNHRLPYDGVIGKILDKFLAIHKPAEDAAVKKHKDYNEILPYVEQMREHRNVYEVIFILKPKRFKPSVQESNYLITRLIDEIHNYDHFLIKNKRK